MKEKIISITHLGYRWEVDACFIAKDRAHYYATQEEPENYEATLQAEYDLAMENDDLLLDWYQGETYWQEIPGDKKALVRTPTITSPEELEDIEEKSEADPVIVVETREVGDDTVPTFNA